MRPHAAATQPGKAGAQALKFLGPCSMIMVWRIVLISIMSIGGASVRFFIAAFRPQFQHPSRLFYDFPALLLRAPLSRNYAVGREVVATQIFAQGEE